MRTTIELKDEHRAKLLEIAARRREKGFSGIVQEAIEAYLRQFEDEDALRDEALRQRGALSAGESERLRAHAASLRESWR